MEDQMEHEMEAGTIQGFTRVVCAALKDTLV